MTVTAVVPPNTTAEVVLPDGQELVVGSGSYAWSVTAAAEVAVSPPVSEETTLADLVDDPVAFAAVLDAITRVDPTAADDVRRHTAWLPGRRVKELFENRVPAAARDRVTAALAEVNAGRAG